MCINIVQTTCDMFYTERCTSMTLPDLCPKCKASRNLTLLPHDGMNIFVSLKGICCRLSMYRLVSHEIVMLTQTLFEVFIL